MESKQKQREFSHLLSFQSECSLLSNVPEEDITQTERPDFLLNIDGVTVGIEHTEYFSQAKSRKGSRLRALESAESEILELAKAKYDALGLPAIHVDVSFRLQASRGRVSKEDIARARDREFQTTLVNDLVRLAGRNVPELPSQYVFIDYPHRDWRLIPEGVRIVAVSRFDFLTESQWTPGRSVAKSRLDCSDIEDEVKRKEDLAPAYRTRCDEVWLLIVSHGFSPSTDSELELEIDDCSIQSSFDRVFYYNFFGHQAHEFSVVRL